MTAAFTNTIPSSVLERARSCLARVELQSGAHRCVSGWATQGIDEGPGTMCQAVVRERPATGVQSKKPEPLMCSMDAGLFGLVAGGS